MTPIMSASAAPAGPFAASGGEQYSGRSQRNACDLPASTHRRRAPLADSDLDAHAVCPTPSPGLRNDAKGCQYPRGLFGDGTHADSDAVNASQMIHLCGDHELSTIYKVSVFDDGSFSKQEEARTVRRDDVTDLEACWNHLEDPSPSNVRVQALFVEDVTLPLLQRLGASFDIDPSFFSSVANRVSSRYQENPETLEDHITVVLPFVHALKNQRPIARSRSPTYTSTESQSQREREQPLFRGEKQATGAQALLSLPGHESLLEDLLSLHMVRTTRTSTIISYHPGLQFQGTSAKFLQSLVQRAGDGAHWSRIFGRSKDPTFLFLAILWYAVYAWEETLGVLFRHISIIEHDALESSDIKLTRQLHQLQADNLHYEKLLREFLRSVEFVRDTPNPAMNAPWISEAEREDSARLLHAEADALTSEVKRLARKREMLSARLDSVSQLMLASVNLTESKAKQRLLETTVKELATLKQTAYLSMVFLPATYLVNLYGMNVHDSLTDLCTKANLACYAQAVSVVGLTLFTSWVVVRVVQKDSPCPKESSSGPYRIL